MKQLDESLSHVDVIRAKPPVYPATAFGSPNHMLPEWASKNTLDLAQRVSKTLK